MTAGKFSLGILGGMGPEATAHLFFEIIRATDAARDQDHIPIVISSNTRIPDRTLYLLRDGDSPLPDLIDDAGFLTAAGVNWIVMPCITAHVFAENLQQHLGDVELLDLVEITKDHLLTRLPAQRTVGLLATDGTIQAGFIKNRFNKDNVKIITPEPAQQAQVMEAIYGRTGIKAGFTDEPVARLKEVSSGLISLGAGAVIAGCTEISMALSDGDLTVPLLDPIKIVAREIVARSGHRLR